MGISAELDRVQKAIIVLHHEIYCEGPSPMKLQKLCYYAQGEALSQGRMLFADDFQAWPKGPVIPALHQEYEALQWRALTKVVMPSLDVHHMKEQLRSIMLRFARYDGAMLQTMVQKETPWIEAREAMPSESQEHPVITKDALKFFFKTTLKPVEPEYKKAA